MDIQNKQHVANLLNHLNGTNATCISLPEPDKTRNSGNDNNVYADTWSSEFFTVRDADPENTIEMRIDGVSLYAYNFWLDGQPVHIVVMDYDTIEPEEAALLPGHCANKDDVINSWLGDTTIDEHHNHPIRDFARIAQG